MAQMSGRGRQVALLLLLAAAIGSNAQDAGAAGAAPECDKAAAPGAVAAVKATVVDGTSADVSLCHQG